MDGPFLVDTFTPLADAPLIAQALMREGNCPFAFAQDARIAYLLQQPELKLHGEACDALIATAMVQGSNRLLFDFLVSAFHPDRESLDFLVFVDAVAWELRGRSEERGPSGFQIQREALIYHELSHLRQLSTEDGEPRYHEDGRPMLALRRHTYEFFQEEIVRYGPLTLGLEQVGLDFVAGAKDEKARRQRKQLRIA